MSTHKPATTPRSFTAIAMRQRAQKAGAHRHKLAPRGNARSAARREWRREQAS